MHSSLLSVGVMFFFFFVCIGIIIVMMRLTGRFRDPNHSDKINWKQMAVLIVGAFFFIFPVMYYGMNWLPIYLTVSPDQRSMIRGILVEQLQHPLKGMGSYLALIAPEAWVTVALESLLGAGAVLLAALAIYRFAPARKES